MFTFYDYLTELRRRPSRITPMQNVTDGLDFQVRGLNPL